MDFRQVCEYPRFHIGDDGEVYQRHTPRSGPFRRAKTVTIGPRAYVRLLTPWSRGLVSMGRMHDMAFHP